MQVSHRRFSYGLNSVCAALVMLGFVAGCSKSGDQTATAASDAAPAASDATTADSTQQAATPTTQAQAQSVTTAPRVARANTSGQSGSYTNDPSYASYQPEEPEPVVSAYVDPPLEQPAPVAVQWAPPPLLVEQVPPQPEPQAVWTGGYWDWQGRWIWAAGRWASPPRPNYGWQQPYYEHRQDRVVYVPGYWRAPEAHFSPPAVGLTIALGIVAVGVLIGHPPEGPQGVFIPPPPGSRPGIVIPCPIGTPPAVILGAPPVIHAGMRVEGNVENNSHNTTINNTRVTNNVTNITNVRNVTIVAPAAATANGREFHGNAPAQAHLAAAQTPVFHQEAPQPSSHTAIASYQAGHPLPASLPKAEAVRTESRPAAEPPQARSGREQPPVEPARPNTPPPRTEPPQAQQPPREESARTAAGTRAVEAQQAQQAHAQAAEQANAARANGARPQAGHDVPAPATAAHNAGAQQADQEKQAAERANEAKAQHGRPEPAAHPEPAQKPEQARENAAKPEAKAPQGEHAKPQPEKPQPEKSQPEKSQPEKREGKPAPHDDEKRQNE